MTTHLTNNLTNSTFRFRFCIWLVGVSFVLFQFFLQLSSGVIINHIMLEMNLTALMAGLLSSSFYFIYTTLQLPVGLLFDRKNTRHLLAYSALLCSVGCIIFSKSTGLLGLFIGRIIIGGGSAFAFVGLSHLLREYYPAKQFAFMLGLSETLGFIATAIGIIGMGEFIAHWGWQTFMLGAAGVGCIISSLCWRFIPNSVEQTHQPHSKNSLFDCLNKHQIWLNGLFVGLSFSVVTVFGALWAIPFIQIKLGCHIEKASLICAFYFIGTGISCPLFGFLANYVTHRRLLILSSCLTTAFLLLMLLYLPIKNDITITLLTFMIGVSSGAYMLSYSISNELAPPRLQSTLMGFTNTLAVLFALILQPVVGYLMDCFDGTGHYTLFDYQKALLLVPISLFIASFLVLFLPEKKD